MAAAEEPSSWSGFHQAALGRPPRELLTRTLNFFSAERRSPGVAVDLGCGSGPDTLELLRRGWTVHAVDADGGGLALLRSVAPPEVATRLHTHEADFTTFVFPRCDLIWASFALPFCAEQAWQPLLQRATAALAEGGRMAGDIFGDRHAWATEEGVLTLSEAQTRASLAGLVIEAFDTEDGWRVSGGEVTRWHAFGFAARKP